LHKGYDNKLPANKNLESHNNHHPNDRDDIIFNPENHFWYNGVKFASLSVVKEMKQNAGGQQNRNDMKAINQLLQSP